MSKKKSLKMTLHGLNLLHSNNSIRVLHTDLFIFPMELTRRICYTINSSIDDHFL